ncbi:MAG: hypothetical protein AAF697_08410 [Pseudomonadota bacterium]
MFEKTPPSAVSSEASRFAGELPLRAFDWEELTARLSAARDLRRVLRKDAYGSASQFADAATRFLNHGEEHQSDVNLVVLEQPKGSSDIPNKATEPNSGHQPGDARED